MAQQQHQRDRETTTMMDKHGTVRTKVAGDDEMLRTGFHNGTPLEAGKIAGDSQPVDLFAPAHRLVHHHQDDDDASQSPQHQQQQQQMTRPEEDDTHRYAASADRPAPPPPPQQGRQGMAEHAAGGRRLGRQA